MSNTDAKRNERRKAREQSRRDAYERIKLLAELLCESHSSQKVRELEGKILSLLLETMPKRVNDNVRVQFMEHLLNCSYGGEPTVVIDDEISRDIVFINGHFAVSDLARRMVWGSSVSSVFMKRTDTGE